MPNDFTTGLKAVLKTALTWGVLLGAFAGTLIGLWALVFAGPGVESLPERVEEAIFAGFAMGVRFALAGAILGTLFATMVRLSFRGKRVADLNPWKFALIGAVISGAGIPLIYQLLNILSGGAIPWNLLTDDIPWAATVGAVGAAGTVWMARRAAALPAERGADQLGAPSPFEGQARMREGETVRRTQ